MPDVDTMLPFLGFGMVVTFMYLIMSKRLSPLVALTLVPTVFALATGVSGNALGQMMFDGIKVLAPTGVMLMFAILYFSVMIEAGLFDPLVKCILRAVGGDPLKIVVGSAILAAVISLDGDGSTTYMITIAAMLPLYRRLGLDALSLTCVTILASGVMNLTPWGGPLARAASALHVDPTDVFLPMLPAIFVGVIGVIGIAYALGIKERQKLADASSFASPSVQAKGMLSAAATSQAALAAESTLDDSALIATPELASTMRRPRLLWFNAVLTLGLMAALILSLLPLAVLFMIGFALALTVNYPDLAIQRQLISNHAKNVISVVSLIFAAGIFTGVLSGTGMVTSMSNSLLLMVPEAFGPHLAPITALASMPFTFFISNDAFYFGVLPVVAEAAQTYGVSPVEVARASLAGQPVHLLSPLVPSTYLLVGLAGVDFGDLQRFTIKWAILVCLLITVSAMVCSAFPIAAG